MQKAILIFLGLLALSTTATVYAQDEDTTASPVVTPDPAETTPGPVVTPDPAETTPGPVVTPDPAETTPGPVVTPDPAETTPGPVVTPDPTETTAASPVVTPDPTETTAASPVVTPDPTETTAASPVVTPDPTETTAASVVTPDPTETTDASVVPNDSTTNAPVDSTAVTSGTTVLETCQSQTETWALDDPRKFYWCLNDKPILTECDEGTYFVNNATVSGCIPEAKMNPSCVNLNLKVGPCEGINLRQPQASKILTNFWLCPLLDAAPIELTCVEDKAFINQDGYLGCFEWKAWRAIRKCNN